MNPLPLILNTTQMVPKQSHDFVERGCLILGGWDYIFTPGLLFKLIPEKKKNMLNLTQLYLSRLNKKST